MANDIDKILEEASVNYEVGNSEEKAEALSFESDEMKQIIDQYYEADKAKKDAEKKMKGLRVSIDAAIDNANIVDNETFYGKEHSLQVVKATTYSLNQEKCKENDKFMRAVYRDSIDGFKRKISLNIAPVELDAVVKALEAAGLHGVVEEIKEEIVFGGKAADVRALNESVEDIDIINLFDTSITTKVSAKK